MNKRPRSKQRPPPKGFLWRLGSGGWPTPQPATARPKRHISEIIRENMSRVPAEILAAMPTDGAGLRTLAPTASDWRNLHGTFREPAATATETIASARQEELDAEDARHAGG
jgi:hypothetical protein